MTEDHLAMRLAELRGELPALMGELRGEPRASVEGVALIQRVP